MNPNYNVIGVVQTQVGGEWSEQPLNTRVRAENPAQARQTALDAYAATVRQSDPYAIVRWHTPELVRAVWLPMNEGWGLFFK